MSLPKSVALAIGIAALTAPAAAHAAAIFETLLPDGSWKVTINGEIVQGDTTSFFNTINRVERNHGRISSVHLNSPGGLVVEGLEIGNKIKSRQFMTIVERGDHCESICFFMFMNGKKKMLGVNARLGMHGASIGGRDAPEVTWQLYEKAMNFFIPEYLGRGIMGMPASTIHYLSDEELASMGLDCDNGGNRWRCISDVLN